MEMKKKKMKRAAAVREEPKEEKDLFFSRQCEHRKKTVGEEICNFDAQAEREKEEQERGSMEFPNTTEQRERQWKHV